MRIRLVGGPLPHQFDVFDADTGAKLTNVLSVEMKIDRKRPTCVVTLFAGLEVDATFDADLELVVVPKRKEV